MIYFIGDLHLDHYNIIKYCNRPFNSTKEMNDTILNRWNSTIDDEDIVYFLGDIAYGRGSRSSEWWWDKLNGNKILIKGNHDRDVGNIVPNHRWLKVKLGEMEFMLVHSPNYFKPKWDGWLVHGHHHNNNMDLYPLVNEKNKTVNVSAELLDYYPLSLDALLRLIEA